MDEEFDYFQWLYNDADTDPTDQEIPDEADCDHCDCWTDHRATCCDCGVSE